MSACRQLTSLWLTMQFLWLMQELDRIFDGEDVLVSFTVDLVDHGGQCRRFPAAGRPGDQDKTARLVAQLFHDRRQIQALKSLDFERDETEHRPDRAALGEHVGAEPAQVFDAERKIYFPFFFELMFLTVGHHAVCESFGVRRVQRLLVDGAQLAVDANLGRELRSSDEGPKLPPEWSFGAFRAE